MFHYLETNKNEKGYSERYTTKSKKKRYVFMTTPKYVTFENKI
jgi:hypothetical protein